MKKLLILTILCVNLFGGTESDTMFYIPKGALPQEINMGMGNIINKSSQMVEKFKSNSFEQNNLKNKKLNQIQLLESNILINLNNITYNQKILNKIEVIK
ncbi:hypothetical protein [Aliarcobacter butzleri]|uniref:hypothetical protein n=1 Tax=Aliarcobacter butzleri TaxID=28197 RepID=UPI002B24F7E2|nr:hypothetical protein [Aliarcobacter butzleri]